MKNFKVELLPAAWEDLQDIFNYISQDSIEEADKVIKDIMKSLRQLEQFPNSGAYVLDNELKKYGFRMVVSYPYISFYRLIDSIVYIYHIAHGARNYGELLKPFIKP